MWTKLWTEGKMYKLKNKELIHLTKRKYHDGGGPRYLSLIKGKNAVAEKSENKLFKYSE